MSGGPYRESARLDEPRYYVEGPWVVDRRTGASLRARWVTHIEIENYNPSKDLCYARVYAKLASPGYAGSGTKSGQFRFYNVSTAEVRRLLTDAMDNDPECTRNL